jgi:hypothetical protein
MHYPLKFGAHVQGFAFFDNKLLKPHVALARCDFTQLGCAIEFHRVTEVGTPPAAFEDLGLVSIEDQSVECSCSATLDDCVGTMAMAIKVPNGIGSLAHDSSVGAQPHQYFTTGFVGTTREYLNVTQSTGAQPEDRIFLMRAPILQTSPRTVTKNWIELTALDMQLMPGSTVVNVPNGTGDCPNPEPTGVDESGEPLPPSPTPPAPLGGSGQPGCVSV